MMVPVKVAFILFVLARIDTVLSAETARYDHYRVYQAIPNTQEQLKTLDQLRSSSDSFIFLEAGTKVGDEFNIVVAPHKLADFTETMESAEICVKVLETDLQLPIDEERNRMQSKRTKGVFDWTEYQELDDIHKWLDKLATEYPQAKVIEAGRSYENRTLKGLKVSYKPGNPGIFLEGGIHAREWISPATVTYILNQLLTSQDPSVRDIAVNYDWYAVPSVNPDGYVYSHKRDRLWRKTRTRFSGGCYGADPNRNWNFQWARQGASHRCTSDAYAGPRPFSEIETRSLSEYIESLSGKIHAYIAFHSYSQLLLFPYGHTSDHAPNHDDLSAIANATVKSLEKRYGTKYDYGNTYDAIYPVSGASAEWAYGVQNIKVAYTYELRPTRSFFGFVLPPAQIIPTGEETLDSLVTLLAESSKRGYFNL
ncbi:zinc carboxypeptidase A 1-like [Toxorhynchites rutilus septentrionalis]|uniref:zinc carboxypeptidase A 1-like n=1 Tax=Toxorhynchites rutilus septentrionalis TaxID=329112 RepID=UPI00247938D6|nr:zinc carboxypeptidase A 1-like [Toxorhynchites rutilus septentrionalis]